VMVDEYQDTNRAQFSLVHALTSGHGNLCVVGDDDQSIYGWRGAEIANLLDMEKYFPKVKVIHLEQNYRSTTTILKAANAVIRHNVRRRLKTLWSQVGEGTKIILNCYSDDEEEARSVVEQIEYERLTRRVSWETQAILFRTNIQSRALETALRQAGVRYHLIGGQSFFDRREVRDLLAYLKAIQNPNDDVSVLRIANTPPRGLSEATMERLLAASHERKGSVFSAMKNPAVTTALPSKARTAIENFVVLLESTRRKLEHPDEALSRPGSGALKVLSERLFEEIGYFDEVRRWEKTAEAAENRIRNLREMLVSLDAAGAALQSPLERLQEFLDEVSLDSEKEEEREEAGNAVTLITMHSCKGLEFPNVFIVGMEDGLLPHSRSNDGNSLDEERRLFYVAITRAMRKLTISHCAARKKYGQPMPCHPSRFLKELPPELVELGDEKTSQPVAVEAGKDIFAAIRASIG
jgi:DNA helicase-2/ATP-dependent DNA helicase PcrA